MFSERSNFQHAIQRVRDDGSDEALWELVETYGPAIRQVVRRRLNRQLRSKFDSVDFVQMVWMSFFREPLRVNSFKEPRQLVGYLAKMAEHKVIEETRRRLNTRKYDVSRECPLLESDTGELPEQRHQTPSQIAIAREYWEQLMGGESERNRHIVQLRIKGASYVEISKLLGIHERTARKVIDRLVQSRFSKKANLQRQ